MKSCEYCWEYYDDERKDASKFFCSKCNKIELEEEIPNGY